MVLCISNTLSVVDRHEIINLKKVNWMGRYDSTIFMELMTLERN